jgi:hypothetical protein
MLLIVLSASPHCRPERCPLSGHINSIFSPRWAHSIWNQKGDFFPFGEGQYILGISTTYPGFVSSVSLVRHPSARPNHHVSTWAMSIWSSHHFQFSAWMLINLYHLQSFNADVKLRRSVGQASALASFYEAPPRDATSRARPCSFMHVLRSMSFVGLAPKWCREVVHTLSSRVTVSCIIEHSRNSL